MNEQQVYEFWESENIFDKTIEQNKSKPLYTFYDGPPFATGLPHYGHILAGLIKDSILRYNHNKGYNVPRFAGFDCHGLPIEYEIEKELGIKTTQQVLEYGIGNYNEACRNIVLKYADCWEQQMGRLGRWIDFKNQYKTMDLNFMNSVWWVFKTLFDKGRVYSGVKIMGYSTSCGTPLSNFEIQQNYQTITDDSLFIKLPIQLSANFAEKYNLVDSNVFILVWTTTPWTLLSNYSLCVGDSINYSIVEYDNIKYICAEKLVGNIFGKKCVEILNTFEGIELIGFNYSSPFDYVQIFNGDNFTHKIISGNFVTDSDGTGIVHLAPMFGLDDYECCIKNNIIEKDSKLFLPLDSNGYVNELVPELKGMFYKNFKDKTNQDLNTWTIIELKKKNYYMEKRTITHNYPFCWRSDTPLIYRAVDSWFIKVEDMRDKLVELNKEINWVPKFVGESRFSNWLANAKDWGISRNRFWGTPIPIWKSSTGKIICIGSSYELEKLAGLETGSITDLHRHFIDPIEINIDGEIYKRIEPIFDCWFESGSMPYATLNNIGIVETLKNNPNFNIDPIKLNLLPADFIAEGLDQTRGWFYTLLVLSASLFDLIPFKNVIVNGLVLAEDGKKMSKRLKNYPDPMEIVETFGSDPLRLYLMASQATKAEPLKFTKLGVHDMLKNIIIPLTNSIVFWKEYVSLYTNTKKSNPLVSLNSNNISNISNISNPINLWVLRKYSELREEYFNHMDNYNLKEAVGVLDKLVQLINNGYIKLGRQLLKGKESELDWIQSLSILYYIIKYILNDFKAIIPFFCEYQFLHINEYLKLSQINLDSNNNNLIEFVQSVHLVQLEKFINLDQFQYEKSFDFDIIYNIILQIYQIRSINNLSLKKPIKNISLIWDDKLIENYTDRFMDLIPMITEETNCLNIDILKLSDVQINLTIKPIKGLIFKKYGKNILSTFEKLNQMNLKELETIIELGEFDGFNFSREMFNFNYDICLNQNNDNTRLDNIVYKEFGFGKFNNKIIILIDLSWDFNSEKIYYWRLVATNIQKSRKNAGLHPWDNIKVLVDPNEKYNLGSIESKEYIEKITRVPIEIYNRELKSNYPEPIYSNYVEPIEITIRLVK